MVAESGLADAVRAFLFLATARVRKDTLSLIDVEEAKIGLRIRDSKPSDTGSCGHSDPVDVDAVNSISSGKGKGSSSPRDGCVKCGGAHFQRDCDARKSTGKQSSGKGKQSKSWSKSEGKGKRKQWKIQRKVQRFQRSIRFVQRQNLENKFIRSGKLGIREKLGNSEICTNTDISWIHDGWSLDEWNDGWSFDEWNDDWSSAGRHEGREQTYDNSASSFSLGGLDLGATSSQKRFEWVKMNLDTGAAVNTFPLNFGPDGAGDGSFHRTASGGGYDENGLLRSLNGRLTGVHKVFCIAAETACKGRRISTSNTKLIKK